MLIVPSTLPIVPSTLQVVVHTLQIELACCNLYFVLYIFHRARATTEKQVESKSAPLKSIDKYYLTRTVQQLHHSVQINKLVQGGTKLSMVALDFGHSSW